MLGAGCRRITAVLAIALIILNDYVNLCAGGYALASSCNSSANAAGYNLACYNLSASSALTANSSLARNSVSTVNNYSSTATNATRTSGGNSRTSLAQCTFQAQADSVVELGSVRDGIANLSLVSFTNTGSNSFSYSYASTDSFNGTASGFDKTTIYAGGAGGFSATGQGSFGLDAAGNPRFTLNQFQWSGGSTSSFTLAEYGSMGDVGYTHADNWNENVVTKEVGSGAFGPSGTGWNFSSYNNVTTTTDTISDQVGGASAWANTNTIVTLSGTGSPNNGTSQTQGWGSYNWNGRGYQYLPTNVTTPATLPTLNIGGFLPSGQPFTWMGVAGRNTTVAPAIAGVASQIGALALPAGKPSPTLPLASSMQLTVPVLASLQLPAYGGWLAPHLAGAPPQLGFVDPLFFLKPTDPSWAQATQALTDALNKATVSLHLNPLALRAMATVGQQISDLNAQIAYDVYAYLGMVADYVTGLLDGLSMGLASRALRSLGLDWMVDQSSTAYKQGMHDGDVVAMMLSIVPGAGIAIRVVQVIGCLFNALDALERGDYVGAAMWLMTTVMVMASGANPCGKGVGGLIIRAMDAGFALITMNLALDKFQKGDTDGFLSDFSRSLVSIYAAMQACFTGDTKLMARGAWGEGWCRIDAIEVGDEVLSRDENDPNGELQWKTVEEKFVRLAPILHVHAGGQVIRTTAEHPFYPYNKGWTAGGELEIGDRLAGQDEKGMRVEDLLDTGVWETVYNLRVADFHTYFVGGEDWGSSVWAHNTYKSPTRRSRRPGTRGHPDHQADVRGLGRAQAESLAGPGETVVTEGPIQGHPGVNRRADNQVIGADGRTRVVVESERRPNGTYHQRRIEQLEAAGIEVQTRNIPPPP